MSSIHRSVLLAAAAMLATFAPLAGQAGGARPNVFFDCEGRNCNSQYYRTEITWVNWVNDQAVSDVHVIMTSVTTGAGGREYELAFLGQSNQATYVDQMLHQTLPTDTEREALDGLAHTLGIGLARFADVAGYRDLVSLEGPDPEAGDAGNGRLVSQEEVDDPWNLWVFRVNGSGNLDGEETSKTQRWNGSFNVSRVTPTWKMNFNNNINYSNREVDLSDGTFTDVRTDFGFRQLVVYSVAEHWSVGLTGWVARLTSFNQNLRVEVLPSIEYSFFPYEEATRRSLTLFYKIGPTYRDYIEETLLFKTWETRWEESLEIEFSSRQTWGDAGLTVTGSHLLDNFDQHNLSLRGDVSYRITRGFSVNARGDIGWVDDQIYLPLGDASDEEALLRLRQRATDFNYGIQVGFSFQFGSIFNNVVNNRFSGIQGFGGFGGGGGGPGGGRGRF